MATPTPIQDELIALEKTLAGFHPTHYIRQSLIEQIAILRPKAEDEKEYLADPTDPRNPSATLRGLEERLIEEKKIKAGYGAGHWILSSDRFDTIPQLTALITQKKTRY